MHISNIEITSKKVRGNNVDFSTSKITPIKVRGDKVFFSTIEIRSKRVRENNVNFLTIEITSEKVHRNNVDFLTIKITSKKYAEMMWKFVQIWFSIYDGLDVMCLLGNCLNKRQVILKLYENAKIH